MGRENVKFHPVAERRESKWQVSPEAYQLGLGGELV